MAAYVRSTTDSPPPPVESSWVPLLPTEFDTARARLRKNVQIRCQRYENEKRRALFKRYLYIYIYLEVILWVCFNLFALGIGAPCRHWRSSSTKSSDDVTYRCSRRQHGSPLVAPGHRYKNSHNFVISDQTCLKLFIRALSITIYLPQYIFTLGFLFL